jgi:hypothetical protein
MQLILLVSDYNHHEEYDNITIISIQETLYTMYCTEHSIKITDLLKDIEEETNHWNKLKNYYAELIHHYIYAIESHIKTIIDSSKNITLIKDVDNQLTIDYFRSCYDDIEIIYVDDYKSEEELNKYLLSKV